MTLVPDDESLLYMDGLDMSEEMTKEEKARLKEERRKAFEAAHPELAAKRKEAEEKKNKVKDKIDGEIDIPFGFCCDEFMMVDNDVIVEISNKLGYIPSVTELMDMVTHAKSKSKVKRRKLK